MSKDDILQFFQMLYGNNPPGYLTVWNRKNFRTKWIEASGLNKVADTAFELAKDRDVYFGIGLRKVKLSETKRGSWQDIMAIPGLWLDIDFYDPKAHVNKNLPKNLQEAEKLLSEFKFKPTLIIHTGHGINPLYLFEDLWIFKDEKELLQAKDLCYSFNKFMINIFNKHGYHLDNVGDLSRTVRVPYTTNFKTEPVPVKIIEYNPESKIHSKKVNEVISK